MPTAWNGHLTAFDVVECYETIGRPKIHTRLQNTQRLLNNHIIICTFDLHIPLSYTADLDERALGSNDVPPCLYILDLSVMVETVRDSTP